MTHDPEGSHYKIRLMWKRVVENIWYFWGITIVPLDSLQIYVDNSFMEVVICQPECHKASQAL
jgi:hypothetical protein